MNSIYFHSNKQIELSSKTVFKSPDLQAIKIQKIVRGFLARKSFLPLTLYPKYSKRCESLNDSTPRASEGKTVVYLPSDLQDVVIKQTGRSQGKKRFAQNEAMRAVVRAAGLNKLIIPRSCLYKEFLVEERLPISVDAEDNAKLYLSKPELFDELARQMTKLFQKAYIDYLVEKNKDDDHLIRIRYDNIPFLIREKKGKLSVDIGLIDLERSAVGENIKTNRHKLYILSSLFPLHTGIIQEEAERSGMFVGKEEKEKITNAAFYAMYYLRKVANKV